MPYERIDPVDRALPSGVAPVRAPVLTPVEREAERRRREDERRRRRRTPEPPPEQPADDGERPRIDLLG